jgi:hypothetical protein
MKRLLLPAYLLCLALLMGGNALYTYLATPQIFRSFERALAGEIVASMMQGYFTWNVVLWVLAAVLGLTTLARRRRGWDLILLGAGLVSSLAVILWLYPAALEVRAKVPSFAAEAPVDAARAIFRRMHGVSMGLNLLEFLSSSALLVRFARCR